MFYRLSTISMIEFYLGCEEYGRGGEEQGIDAVKSVLGVESLEIDSCCGDDLLPQFELLPQSLDEVGEKDDDLLVLFFSCDSTTLNLMEKLFKPPNQHAHIRI